MTEALVLEGTWEEVAAHADELAGRRVRLTVLPENGTPSEVRDGAPEDYPVTPFFMTDEYSVPIDVRRKGEGVVVPFVDGGQRPPQIPAEWRDDGSSNV